MTRDDIINSLTRQSQAPGHVLELRESANEETAQSVKSDESGGSSRHGRSRLWIATLTLIGIPVALWLSGLLPGSIVNMGDSGIDYVVSKATSLGPILLGEIATIGLVIMILGKRMRHESSSHMPETGEPEE